MNQPVYHAELERIVRDLARAIDNKSLDPIVEQALNYAYILGKNEGYAAGVQAIVGDQR